LLDWRIAFFIVGLAGIAIAPIFKLTIHEPRRGGFDRQREDVTPPGLKTILRLLALQESGLAAGLAIVSAR
jgi:hypothetical protein